MLFRHEFHPGIADGSITCTYRRWKRPQARPGGRYRVAPLGMIEVTAVSTVHFGGITQADAARCGLSLDALTRDLREPSADELVHRIDFRFAGRDMPAPPDLSDEVLERKLARYPWADDFLRLIDSRPGVAARLICQDVRRDRKSFKADVRKLKALGLTESLEIGYRLSPRGRRWLRDRYD